MNSRLRRALSVAAFAVVFPAFIGAAPMTPSEDLSQSYRLLTTTYYSKVDAQKLLDGAHQALNDDVVKAGAHVTVPAFHDAGSSDRNLTQIASTIAHIAAKSRLNATQLFYDAIAGMANSLGDRYTQFFSPEAFREFNSELDPEKISGIGVIVREDQETKYIRAYYVVPGTPADRAGLQTGDLFENVDGKSLKGATADVASSLLRGKPGTIVHVVASRDGKDLPAMDITRSEVQPPTVIYKMLPDDVGYIYILAFGRDTPDEFSVALQRLQSSNARAYILDLRDDGGGYVNSALDISSRFINNDPLVTIEERGNHSTTVDAGGDAITPKPMAILVNKGTASASEITAGALQDDGVAVLVGEKTFGKGVMQELTPLADGAAIKITTAHYLTPKNRDINLKGIVPDYAVSENKDARFGEIDHDAQLQAALNIVSKKVASVKN